MTFPLVQAVIPAMLEQAEKSAAEIVQGMITDATVDEVGQPYAVPVRAIYSSDVVGVNAAVLAPSILVELRPGRITFERALNAVIQLPDGSFGRQVQARDSLIRLHCRERGEAERRYLLDLTLSCLLTGYAVGPPVIEAALLVAFGDVGITPHGLDETLYPDPVPSESRPEGMLFTAILQIRADVALTWSTPPSMAQPPADVATAQTFG